MKPRPCARRDECGEPNESDALLAFNQQLLAQAGELAAAHGQALLAAYAGAAGAHLRHIIEHLEALVFPPHAGVVDYDSRPRDRALETRPALAQARLLALQQQISHWHPALLDMPVSVCGHCGSAGDFRFTHRSSIGRELAFVASHTVHHFALLAAHCQQHGIPTPADFGKAPATVAHERASHSTSVMPASTSLQDSSWPHLPLQLSTRGAALHSAQPC